mmetsp:Transcript_31520/g.68989  ORF Transcript_31520/g.68989 Transcript_31520/m.68989 type:complete len:267 (+) Transcript_31520:112-912(+)|eukprot:CAMPEP_0204271482 /NCGR_PEP_ID=MMETSP0468-20130131/20010_1 /ASSEMBLY_ACC=CAM_ASM_000383 /TAXON_ID=2969 /ORGANISM="Oxyrrhis marina" /LENGTH=266 /DNA_ID=CAMNT_0051247159 /DNA_START=85 /DNA_END=885 /DNA_ORIENTATION=+
MRVTIATAAVASGAFLRQAPTTACHLMPGMYEGGSVRIEVSENEVFLISGGTQLGASTTSHGVITGDNPCACVGRVDWKNPMGATTTYEFTYDAWTSRLTWADVPSDTVPHPVAINYWARNQEGRLDSCNPAIGPAPGQPGNEVQGPEAQAAASDSATQAAWAGSQAAQAAAELATQAMQLAANAPDGTKYKSAASEIAEAVTKLSAATQKAALAAKTADMTKPVPDDVVAAAQDAASSAQQAVGGGSPAGSPAPAPAAAPAADAA